MGKPHSILVAFGLALSLAACGSDEAPERAYRRRWRLTDIGHILVPRHGRRHER